LENLLFAGARWAVAPGGPGSGRRIVKELWRAPRTVYNGVVRVLEGSRLE
jgi:hypothetical protein